MYSNNLIICFILLFFLGCTPQKNDNSTTYTEPETSNDAPLIVTHYMTWYSDSSAVAKPLRHWEHGHANTPLIGKYDSKATATLVYHALLAWSAGIDAIAVNIKDQYDYNSMVRLLDVIDELHTMTDGTFDLKYMISYDDQGFDLAEPLDTTIYKMQDFKSNLSTRKHYVHYEDHPVFFSFDYPNKFLTAQSFRTVIDTVFQTNKPYLIWNTFGEGETVQPYVDAFYPWVQPGGVWDEAGLNWGEGYLEYFYDKVNSFETRYDFVVGGVWPGFDDRKNTSWGGNRLMSRQDTKVYQNTWKYIQDYQGDLPMQYVVIETWNDWNEGTEIEPSKEHGYQYLVETIKQINQLKNSNIREDTSQLEKVKMIHDAIADNGNKISNSIRETIIAFCK